MGCSSSAVESDLTRNNPNSEPEGKSSTIGTDSNSETATNKNGSHAAVLKQGNPDISSSSPPQSGTNSLNGGSSLDKDDACTNLIGQGATTSPVKDQSETASHQAEEGGSAEFSLSTKAKAAEENHAGQSSVTDEERSEVRIQSPVRGSPSPPIEPRTDDSPTAEPQMASAGLPCMVEEAGKSTQQHDHPYTAHNPSDNQLITNPAGNLAEEAAIPAKSSEPLGGGPIRSEPPGDREEDRESCNRGDSCRPSAAEAASADDEPRRLADEHQARFSQGVRSFCRQVEPGELLQLATPLIRSLVLERAPGACPAFPFRQLLRQLAGITELNLSGNRLGPQAFRVIILSMCHNTTIKSLDLANNQADTDTSECLGEMLTLNSTLAALDVSSNQLGRDFFSRCVGPALITNSSLDTLRASSCGLADLNALLDGLAQNTSIQELDLSHNQISDGQTFARKLGDILKSPSCQLRALHLRNCGLGGEAMNLLAEALRQNSSIENLSAGGNAMACPADVFSLLVTCIRHPTMTACTISDIRLTSTEPAMPSTDTERNNRSPSSPLRTLSIANCSLGNDIIQALATQLPGSLPNLSELDLTGNQSLTALALEAVSKIVGAGDKPSNLHHLKLGSLSIAGLPDVLLAARQQSWPGLRVLDLRRSKVSPQEVAGLGELGRGPDGLQSLTLDGLKLSGSKCLEHLLSSGSSCSIASLSLAGCALQDADLAPIAAAVSQGWHAQSVNLSANRIKDTGALGLVEAFLSRASECTLVELNMANNRLSDGCAAALAKLVRLAPRLHSLLLGNNHLGGASLRAVLASFCPMESGRPKVLDLASQEAQLNESEIEELLSLVAKNLGFAVMEEGDGALGPGLMTGPLPAHPAGLTLSLTGLGASGESGQALDSPAVRTDYGRVQRPWLSLQHALDLGQWLKGDKAQDSSDESEPLCCLTSEEWCKVLGVPKDPTVPSWLQVSSHRSRALYLTGLPGSVSAGKLEGDLEAEADCSVEEVCVMKDIIQRKPNGTAWVLLGDQASVQKATRLFSDGKRNVHHRVLEPGAGWFNVALCKAVSPVPKTAPGRGPGQTHSHHDSTALMFSQPYTVSGLRLSVTGSDASQDEGGQARLDIDTRALDAAREQAEHRTLLASSYQASQERHEYAKANPAYADGRIW